MLTLYNTLSKSVEDFIPLQDKKVGLYTCGMTVYDYAHIGHGRKYVGDDILRRSLKRFGYEVMHVQNVTDVGHLVSDGDSGEDKLEKGAKKQGKSVWEVAQFFTDHFYHTMDVLGNLRPHVICKATEHIREQIALVERLIQNGFAYDTPEAVYFEVAKFPAYESLFGRQKLEDKKTAARDTVNEGEHKKTPADFALWFKRVGRFADHSMHWESPWGDGFPGWHIECSAMSMKYLGESFDVHTGGIDHIPIHHPNEIAQSEAATGRPFVKYWVHHNFLRVDGKKMSKSLGNFNTIEDVLEKGIEPMALRYFYLTAHYRSELNFTWESLSAAAAAYKELIAQCVNFKMHAPQRHVINEDKLQKVNVLRQKFDDAIASDLNTPKALAVVWETVKASISTQDKYDLLLDFDEVLGLGLSSAQSGTVQKYIGETSGVVITSHTTLSPEVIAKLDARALARNAGDFAKADQGKKELLAQGFRIDDTADGVVVK